MTEAILRGQYYYATVEDKPGVLYNVLEHLRQRNVRLLAFTVFPLSGGRSLLDFFPIDTDAFLDRLATRHGHALGRSVTQIIPLVQQGHVTCHNIGFGSFHTDHNGGRILVDHDR